MYPYRITTRAVPRACGNASRCGSGSSSSSRNIFTTPFFNPAAELNGLVRLLDNAAAELLPSNPSFRHGQRWAEPRSFTPRFDVREVGSNYELQGEVPGIKQSDLEIEFVDERTLVIRGRSEREYTEGTAPEALKAVEGAAEQDADKAIANDDAASQKSGASTANYHKASVEDEYVDAGAEAGEPSSSEKPTNTDLTTSQHAEQPETAAKTEAPKSRYWVSERSVGEFERRFNFPGRVDQDAVTASLKNGILSVVVPKIVEKGTRRIEVQ